MRPGIHVALGFVTVAAIAVAVIACQRNEGPGAAVHLPERPKGAEVASAQTIEGEASAAAESPASSSANRDALELRPEPLEALFPTAFSFLQTRPPQWGTAVYLPDRGEFYGANSSQQFPLSSLMKVPMLLTYLSQAESIERDLSDDEIWMLEAMITFSDNDAADTVWWEIGGGEGVADYLESVGAEGISPALEGGRWGDSTASAAAMVRILARLTRGEVLGEGGTRVALDLLARTEPGQRWGATAVFPTGSETPAAVKNGWYPAISGWRAGSAAVSLDGEMEPLVLVVLTRNAATFEDALATIEGVALRIGSVLYGTEAPEDDFDFERFAETAMHRAAPGGSDREAIEGQCTRPSSIARRVGAWACSTSEGDFDPCFETEDGGVICDVDPRNDRSGLALYLVSPLPELGNNQVRAPAWFLLLEDGTGCGAVSNGDVDEDGDRVAYYCEDGSLLVGGIQRTSTWWVHRVLPDDFLSVETPVSVAWY